jgi:hypothetical protein
MVPHDSIYLGADIFYTYIVQNGGAAAHEEKTQEGYYEYAPELKEKLLHGKFQRTLGQFFQMWQSSASPHHRPLEFSPGGQLRQTPSRANLKASSAPSGEPSERFEAFENASAPSTPDHESGVPGLSRELGGGSSSWTSRWLLVQRSPATSTTKTSSHVAASGIPRTSSMGSKRRYGRRMGALFRARHQGGDRTVGDYARIVCLDDPRGSPISYADRRNTRSTPSM